MAQDPDHLTPERMRAVTERAATLRGGIITSYAQVEMLLGDVVMRCIGRPEYSFLPEDFPQHLTARIQRVRAIVHAPGPLAPHKDAFEAIILGLRRYEEIRHFLAHGLLRIGMCSNTIELEYRMWRQVRGRAPEMGMIVTNPMELSRAATEIAAYSNQAVTLFRDVYRAHGLEPA